MQEVVENLGIQTKIFSEKGILKSELYGKDAPLIIRVISEKKLSPEEKIKPVNIKIAGNGNYRICSKFRILYAYFNQIICKKYTRS